MRRGRRRGEVFIFVRGEGGRKREEEGWLMKKSGVFDYVKESPEGGDCGEREGRVMRKTRGMCEADINLKIRRVNVKFGDRFAQRDRETERD